MDINTFAAWGEFLGGAGVIVSLLYLALQIRQNSRLLRSSTGSAASTNTNTINSLLVQDPEVARIFWDGMVDRSSLSEADARRFEPLMGLLFTLTSQEYQSGPGEPGDATHGPGPRSEDFRRLAGAR